MHQFLPLARLFEHLGDRGLITPDKVPELLVAARDLNQLGYDEHVIIEALLNWEFHTNPNLRKEVTRFREDAFEHQRLMGLRIKKGELLDRMRPMLNGEWPDIEAAFSGHSSESELTAGEAINHIPPHHPKAIDALVLIFLGHAKDGSTPS